MIQLVNNHDEGVLALYLWIHKYLLYLTYQFALNTLMKKFIHNCPEVRVSSISG